MNIPNEIVDAVVARELRKHRQRITRNEAIEYLIWHALAGKMPALEAI